jgi:hypothetical protein
MWKIADLLNDDLDTLGSSDFDWHYCKENARSSFVTYLSRFQWRHAW